MKIIIADDHALINQGVATFLQDTMDDITVLQAQNKSEVIRFLNEQPVDVIIQDIKFGKDDARDIVHEYLVVQPKVKIIALSTYADQLTVKTVLANYFSGYVSKSAPMEEIVCAIHSTLKNEKYISSDIKDALAKQFLQNATIDNEISLTQREKQVLSAVQDGFSTKEIASKMHLSEKTIESYRSNLFQKFDARNVAELVKKSLLKGFVE